MDVNQYKSEVSAKQVAVQSQTEIGPYTADELHAIVYARFNGDISAVHAHLNRAQCRADALYAEAYEARRDHLNAQRDEALAEANDLQDRIDQVRAYCRTFAAPSVSVFYNNQKAA